VEIFQQYKLVI